LPHDDIQRPLTTPVSLGSGTVDLI